MANETIITKPFIKEIGDKVSELSGNTLSFVSEKLGIETASFQIKILTLIFLAFIFLIALKIANKTTKIILVILVGALIISTLFSMFS